MLRHKFAVMTLALTIPAVFWSIAQAQSQSAAPTIVAVVNLAEVFDKIQMVNDLERIFSEKRAALQNDVDKRKEQIQKIQLELDSGAFAPESSDYVERGERIEKMKLENELWFRKHERWLRKKRKEYFEDVYKRVTAATREIAELSGVDVVLTNNPIDFEVNASDALIAQILQKKVIYASPRVDLTAAVLTRVDQDYLAAGGSKLIDLAK